MAPQITGDHGSPTCPVPGAVAVRTTAVRTTAVRAARTGPVARTLTFTLALTLPLALAEPLAFARSAASRRAGQSHAAALLGAPQPGLFLGGESPVGLLLTQLGHELLCHRTVRRLLLGREGPAVARFMPERARRGLVLLGGQNRGRTAQ